MRRFFSRVTNLFRRRGAEREMAREMESHLALLQEDFERHGMPPQEAALAARRAYGGVEFSKELHRDARSFVWVEQLFKDVRYAARNLMRSPGFTLVAALAVSFGIGANATIFGIYNGLLWKPLPVADAGRVVRIKRWFASGPRGDDQYNFQYPEVRYLREHSTVYSGIAIEAGGTSALATIAGRAVPEHIMVHPVSGDYFGELGVHALIGRTFLPEEDRAPGANPVIVLGYRFWQRKLDGNPGAVGRTLLLDGMAYTMVGVMPKQFTGTDRVPLESDGWVPLSMLEQLWPTAQTSYAGWREQWRDATPPFFELLARLRPGVSRGRAQAETELLVRQFLAGHHEADRTKAVTLQNATTFGESQFFSGYRGGGNALWMVTSLVLLAACANVANMLLARGAVRQGEIGIRLALGAGRGRIIRQLLMESTLLSTLGGAAGILVARWAGRSLWIAVFGSLSGMGLNVVEVDLSTDSHVLLYGLGLCLVTGGLFGLSPALRSTRAGLGTVIKETGRTGAGMGRSRLRGWLLGAQVAVSVMLLTATGDLLSSMAQSRTTNLGFDARNTYLLTTDQSPAQAEANNRRLRERLARLPEMSNVAFGDVPYLYERNPSPMMVGKLSGPSLASHASDSYFETLNIRMVRGRAFTRQEADRRAPVAVISESAARHFWPGEDALGKRFSLDLGGHNRFKEYEVAGIAADARLSDITQVDAAHVYLPAPDGGLLFRIQGDRQKALAAVTSTVESADRTLLPSLNLISLEEGPAATQRVPNRVIPGVMMILILLALVLAGLGIYGVTALLVSQRNREIGIRIALGATPRAILGHFTAQGLRPVFVGLASGVALGWAGATWERSQEVFPDANAHSLFGSPGLYLELIVMLAMVALACLIPARRALRVDPAVTLRDE